MLKTNSYYHNFGATELNLLPKRFRQVSSLDSLMVKIVDILGRPENLVYIGPRGKKLNIKNTTIYGFTKLDNVESWAFIDNEIAEFMEGKDCSIVITKSYLHYLTDPRPLLRAIKLYLLNNPGNKLVIVNDSVDATKATRQWSNNSKFISFLESSGFVSEKQGNKYYTSLAITQESISKSLIRHNLNSRFTNYNRLIVTTEDNSVGRYGGIGTYIDNIKKINKGIPILFCEHSNFDLRNKNLFTVNHLVGRQGSDNFFNGNGIVEAVKVILYLLPNINTIEYQDYQSIGFRIVQAKKAGQIPVSTKVCVFLHGGLDHIKYGQQDDESINYSLEGCKSIIKDYYVTDNSDICLAPSEYVVDELISEFGYSINNPLVKRLPFDIGALPDTTDIQVDKIKKIIFIGKHMRMKGYDDFVSAINMLKKSSLLNKVEEVISIGPGEIDDNNINNIQSFRKKYNSMHLDHQSLMLYIENNKNHSVFVVPARNESYSYVVLELMLLGCNFIAYKSGGVPEVLGLKDTSMSQRVLINEPKPELIYSRLADMINADEHSRELMSKKINKQRLESIKYQQEINKSWSYEEPLKAAIYDSSRIDKLPSVSVCIPFYNTKVKYIRELLESIESSTIVPEEVIVINDGSSDKSSKDIIKIVKEFSERRTVSYRVVNQINTGLAGARNRGVREAKTDYVYCIDSDDVFTKNSLLDVLICASLNKEYIAISGFPQTFTQLGSVLSSVRPLTKGEYWKFLGTKYARSISMKENQFISASCLVKRSRVMDLGGWDESDRSTQEDLAFFNKLAWSDKEIGLVPDIGYFYRDTPGSMSKTYNLYLGRRRQIRNIPKITRLDASVILSLINGPQIDNIISFSEEDYLHSRFGTYDTAHISKLILMSKLLHILGKNIPKPIRPIIRLNAVIALAFARKLYKLSKLLTNVGR